MFEFFTGTIIAKKTSPNVLVMDCHGVGLSMYVSQQSWLSVNVNDTQRIYVHMQILANDSAVRLYGFLDLAERGMFELLSSVKGIGAKSAMSILSRFSASDVRGLVFAKDSQALAKADGIGIKTADRIIFELSAKEKQLRSMVIDQQVSGAVVADEGRVVSDLREILGSLGYPDHQIERSLSKVIAQTAGQYTNYSVDELLRECMGRLG